MKTSMLILCGALFIAPQTNASGLDDVTQGILGAKKVDVANSALAPWVPKILTIDGDADGTPTKIGTCTGSLIGARVVLTAAHCVFAVKGRKMNRPTLDAEGKISGGKAPMIMLGLPGNGVGIGVDFVIHSKYRSVEGRYEGDLALIKLERPVAAPVGRGARLVLDTQDLATPGRSVEAIGYGVSQIVQEKGWFSSQEKRTDDGLRQKTLQIIASSDPTFTAQQTDALVMQSPAGAEAGNVCSGDSGGPILARQDGRYVIVGVNSRSYMTCTGTASAVKTSLYNEWIRSQVAAWGLSLYN